MKASDKAYTVEQQSVIKDAKALKMSGATPAQGYDIYKRASDVGLKTHAPMIHPERTGIWSYTEHVSVTKLHIKIIRLTK